MSFIVGEYVLFDKTYVKEAQRQKIAAIFAGIDKRRVDFILKMRILL